MDGWDDCGKKSMDFAASVLLPKRGEQAYLARLVRINAIDFREAAR